MRVNCSPLLLLLAGTALAQAPATYQVPIATPSVNSVQGLPIERIGPDDLVAIGVYDCPELTRTVRVSAEGELRLPMLKHPIKAEGLYPQDLETAITAELVKDQLIVDPIVTVSVVEYRSRPIMVAGAVKKPLVFQATGQVTLLDAISQAEGLAENAGPYVLVTYSPGSTTGESNQASTPGEGDAHAVRRISIRELLSGEDPSLNLRLHGGEEIRVPEAGRVFVVGDVKKPGTFYITDGSESSVLKALALSQGLDSFPSHTAYIYRREAGSADKKEIKVQLKDIMNRKAPDVALMANDILYIPTASGTKASMKVLEESVGLAGVMGAATLYTLH